MHLLILYTHTVIFNNFCLFLSADKNLSLSLISRYIEPIRKQEMTIFLDN